MKPRKIKKLLIANRGEIALRIHRSASEIGVRTVAVFSDVDRSAPHVFYADEAYPLNGNLSQETYLDTEKLITIARKAKCDAIHPGYGFLSENPSFAEATSSAGILFVGPPASAMRIMGSKTSARNLMQKAKVPIVPGTHVVTNNYRETSRVARQVGYPLLVKAVHGGGGKGMRKVEHEEDLESSLKQAQSESLKAFGSADVYIEKYLQNPRHIEIQILADNNGNVIFLGERECSIQRRHQKVIEECPSSRLSPEMRNKMGRAAVSAARGCGYVNAGTIEFMLDEDDSFYFLEINTRIQVEHPVTETVYGIDLVKEQLRIAQGEKLSLTQEQVISRGHAIECRIYAEDPSDNFLPSVGTVEEYAPSEGSGIRNDSGIFRGSEVSRFYDPLLAKLIAWGSDRDEARLRMVRALSEYKISGVATTIPFCAFVLSHPRFVDSEYNIRFVENYFQEKGVTHNSYEEMIASFVAASMFQSGIKGENGPSREGAFHSKWKLGRFDE